MKNEHMHTTTIEMPDGRIITLETGKMAKQADGAIVLSTGRTKILATVVSPKEAKEGISFLPLTVDYQEKFSASGRIPGGFFKREARLSNYEVLISRIVDRAIRPLFPDGYNSEIQVMASLISSDDEVLPDSLVGLAVSTALQISDIPWNGPISEVRVVRNNGEMKINPLREETLNADFDIIVAGTMKDINMVEGSLNEVAEEDLVEALRFAHEEIKKQCQVQIDFAEKCEKPKREFISSETNEELFNALKEEFEPRIKEIARAALGKNERTEALSELWTAYESKLAEDEVEDMDIRKKYFNEIKKESIRQVVLNDKIRLDGRKYDEIREISSEIDLLPSTHGSALFTRGETQSLTSITLGGKMDEQMIDGAVLHGYEKFILHYNFPAFSTGEAKPNRGPGRREIGHGALAKRAIEKQIPDEETNPYTIRVVSDILESNGSSSMATVCAASLALMDAGIQIKNPVSGIAMGLIFDNASGKYAVLSDILGDEDHLGDMDFKVTGTENGITACQMDIKVDGLSYEILTEALHQAKKGRLHILGEMKKTIAQPNPDYKAHAPRIEKLLINNEFIGAVIGPGGKVIQEIQKVTGTHISIEEKEDGRGLVEISSVNQDGLAKALAWIKSIIEPPEVNKVYSGKVKSIKEFGAFIEFLPGKEGLLHNTEYSWNRNKRLADYLKHGDVIDVKLLDIDKQTGKFRLSRKALYKKPEGYTEPERRNPRSDNKYPKRS
jgi:polyribonucleotide nucleotidyltransferase